VFHVKICGITTADDAMMVALSGADAIGLNFYPKSPRFVDYQRAGAILRDLPTRLVKIGLFVNSPHEEVCRRFDDLELDMIQLHGDEPPEYLKQLGDRPVVRAFRLGEDGLRPALDYLDQCANLECLPDMVLLDGQSPLVYGGSGTVGDWQAWSEYQGGLGRPPMVLAGGLTADNVADAIQAVQPVAVDTASGVESSPGRKSARLVARFVDAARKALGLP
jgi:phosphoribosylanthranilate isomerase